MIHTPGGIAETEQTTDLAVQGMHCASCVRRTEQALAHVPGVRQASVNFATETARIVHNTAVPVESLIEAVEGAGYHATASAADAAPQHTHGDDGQTNLILAVALTIPSLLISMLWSGRPQWADWLLLALTTPVVFWCGRSLFASAWSAARHGSATMDTLVAMGAGVAWLASLYGLLTSPEAPLYFDSAAAIVTLILFGRHLEWNARHSMTDAIGKLLDLAPKTASFVTPGAPDRIVLASSLQIGDLVRVRPGEAVPADGEVVDGDSYFDESLLTGEPSPVRRTAGDPIVGGSLNGAGSVVARVVRTVSGSRPAQIARLVADAQASKAPLQSLADRVASVFVPAVIAVAAVTFLWRLLAMHEPPMVAMLPAVAVLVVACPCALGLATPTAIVAGVGRGARLGILIRDGATLERAASVRTVLLDKTGTITEGRPSVLATASIDSPIWECAGLTALWPARLDALQDLDLPKTASSDPKIQNPNSKIQSLLHLVAAVEVHSEHPLAKAIVQSAQRQGVELPNATDFQSFPGQGVEAAVEGHRIAVGSPRFVGVLPPELQSLLEDAEGQGQTVVAVAEDGQPIGLIAIGDNIRPGSEQAITELKSLGIESVMLTGDRLATAEAVAHAVGIATVRAELLPEDKSEVVKRLAASGTVAMVGDGVNDAPALAAADVGIALGAGSDIAKVTAGIVLLKNDLGAVPQAIRLARRTSATIRANLAWAFVYNIAAIPFAASGRLDPMIAAAAMAFSSLSVVLNSLRLARLH